MGDDRRTDEGKRRCGQGKKHRRWKKNADDKKADKANGSILEEDGKTTTAEPTKAKDDAGKGKSTGDGKKNADKEKKEEKANGSILEEDGTTTTAEPTKAKDDAGKGKSTGDEKKNA